MSDDLIPAAGSAAADALAPASSEQLTRRYESALMNTFGTPRLALVRGAGPYVWDADGRRYLDLLGGIAVTVLGHAHPTLTAAISAQLGTLGHVSNFFATPTQVALAERLLDLAQAPEGSRVFFTNSGTESVEAIVKIARSTGRPRILVQEGAFHGRSLGALALTHKAAYRTPFGPMLTGVEFLPFGDAAALEAAMGDDVAAIVLEPIQGEAGVRPLPAGFLRLARELADRHGALLAYDEVQTGVGRTGSWFAWQHPEVGDGVRPDLMSLAKGLGGGFPMGAVVAFGAAGGLLGPGQHGTTFGGNPVAAAAGLATLRVIERDGLLAHVREVGARLASALAEAPVVREVRGTGFMLGVALVAPAAARVQALAQDAGFIVNAVTADTIRLVPPLVLTWDQVAPFVDLVAALTPADLEES